ncbi:ABC-type transport auxiliary lipoprotein family protein [Thiohalorhabdus sp.]|uniref:ABC-type transport auxiliary lipoprotein family protein n=1 Tax=Thiohalorhabdus sp. TaxID=3094134 RepID=UPI002FC3B868
MIGYAPTLGLLSALFLSACVSLPEAEAPPERYVLTPIGLEEATTVPGRIEVASPVVPAGLASDRIAVMRGGRRLDHFAGARWAAPLPQLVRDFLITSVENRLGAAAWASSGAPARYRLVTAVRDFQAEYPQGSQAPPTVRMTLIAVLWDQSRGRVVLRQRFAASQQAEANRLEAVTAALEGLLQQASGAVLARTAHRLGGNA